MNFIICPIAILGALISYLGYQWFFSPLKDIPGPFLASFSRIWLARRVANGDMIKHISKLHRKFGPLVRIAPDEISVVCESAVKQIYGIGAGYEKSEFYVAMGDTRASDHQRDIFSMRNARRHGEKRRYLSQTYSMTSILKAEHFLDDCLAEFMAVLEDGARGQTTLDLGACLHHYTFDAIGVLFFGEPFGFQSQRRDIDGLIDILTSRTKYNAFFGVMPSIRRFQWLLELVTPTVKRGIRQNRQLLIKADQAVKARMNNPSDRQDILSSVLELPKQERRNFTVAEVITEAYGAIAAGNDSTATALRAVFYYLLKNPHCMRLLLQELDQAEKSGQLSDLIRYNEAARLPYLVAVIKEAMRMFPSVGLTLPRVVPTGGAVIAGKFIPEGTIVGMNAHAVHFDRSVFGPDADSFNPDRWMSADAARMERCFLEFGSGSRSCIGKHLALCEMYRIVPNVLRLYHLELDGDDPEWTVGGGWFTNQKGIIVKVRAR